MRDSGGEFLQYRLVIEPRAARRARKVVGSVLEGWRLGALADDVVSCVSELVANVYEHTWETVAAGLLFAVMIAFSGHDNVLIGVAVVLLAVTLAQATIGRLQRPHAGPVPPRGPGRLKVS